MSNTIARRGLLAAAAATALARPVRAQGAWPSRPIRIIVPFPPGGSNDVVARPLAERLQQRLGQPVVIENRPGAGSTIGAAAAAQSAPDGYTLMVTSSSFVTSSIVQRTSYGVEESFEPVALLARAPFFILTAPNFSATTVQDLVRLAKERPGGIDYGSSGPGGINHFITEYFAQRAGVTLNHIPYRGTGPAVTDLVAGHIQLLITTMASASGPAREGRVRLLAYTAPGAPPDSPQAPLVKDAGIDYEVDIFWGMFAPRGLPAAIRDRLNEAVNAALQEPDMARLMQGEGARPSPTTPEAFGELVRQELARWRDVARIANIRVE